MNADFSRTLALLRQEKGISQRKAAKELGISQALLSHYENGIREPGLAFVKKACDYYHVSADYLLGRTLDRDGGMIDAESLYDSSDEKGTLRGSIAATLQKKMLVNTAGVLFELLGKTNDRTLITSAGGYLAGSAGVMSESKPDFMVLIYPVVSSDPDKRHLGTFQQLVGKENVETEAAKFSLEKVVDSTACPALIFHSDDDKVVPAINAALLYEKLKANGVKASLHIFPSGGHGWGMSKKFKYHENFKAATLDWLKVINAGADKAAAKK